ERNTHVLDGIQRIEDAEDIDTLPVRLAHKRSDDIVRIRGVADRVGPAQKHLEANVGNGPAQLTQPLPRVLVQKPHRGIKRSPTPHLNAKEIRQALSDSLRRRE